MKYILQLMVEAKQSNGRIQPFCRYCGTWDDKHSEECVYKKAGDELIRFNKLEAIAEALANQLRSVSIFGESLLTDKDKELIATYEAYRATVVEKE